MLKSCTMGTAKCTKMGERKIRNNMILYNKKYREHDKCGMTLTS